MASKVIGFRVAEDLAEELEKVSEERGMTVAKFMRSLVDETLYPGAESHAEENSNVTREQIESLSNSQKELASNVQELSASVELIGVKIAGYESEGILSSKIVDTIREMKTIKSDINDLEHKVDTLSMKLKGAQDIIQLVNEYKASSSRSYTELQKEVINMGRQLAAIDNPSPRITQLESEVAHLSTDITIIKREIKRQPTGDTRMVPLKDGSERKFKVYKSPEGLVKPDVVAWDPFGNKYIDLSEPLD